MMTKLFRTGLVICVLAFAGGILPAQEKMKTKTDSSSEELWMTDFVSALTRANKLRRPLIVLFTGSDWCAWCVRLNKNIWEKDTFKKWAKENAVLVKIDFPHRKLLSAEESAKNESLAQRYFVSGFPTVLILSADGKELGRTGYKQFSPEKYIRHLESFCKK